MDRLDSECSFGCRIFEDITIVKWEYALSRIRILELYTPPLIVYNDPILI